MASLNKMIIDPLDKRLTEIGYPRLFMSGDQNLAEKVWDNGNNKAKLLGIIQNKSCSLHARFLAAEILRYFKTLLNPDYFEVLAEAYAYALANTSADKGNIFQLNGNLWGFLYEENDPGYLGQQFINFGDASVPHLIELLDDNDGRILYEGSKEATVGNAYGYRIKDFAAFYISQIKDIPVSFHQDFEKRDQEIETLKLRLKND